MSGFYLIRLDCLFLLGFCLFGLKGHGQSDSIENIDLIRKVNPPDGRYLYDNLFMDVTEMTNIGYKEYLYAVKSDSSKAFYESQLLDSTVWQEALSPDGNPLTANYFNEKFFRFFPVIGVSYGQAQNYCRWRSRVVTRAYNKRRFKRKLGIPKEYEIHIVYRLPTEEEWEYAAKGGLPYPDYPYGIERDANKRQTKVYTIENAPGELLSCLDSLEIQYASTDSVYLLEFNVQNTYYLASEGTDLPCHLYNLYGYAMSPLAEVYDTTPNAYGIYGMIGNVAEMIQTEEVAKGGHFNAWMHEFDISTQFTYYNPFVWLGFRCIAEVNVTLKK